MTAITCLGKTYRVHRSAARFPILPHELETMVKSLRENGQLDDIIEHEGEILDGRTRLTACDALGVEPRIRAWDGECGTPVKFIRARNIDRRHMEKSQWAMLADDLADDEREEAKQRSIANLRKGNAAPAAIPPESADLRTREESSGETAKRASDSVGGKASPRMVELAREIKRRDPEKAERVRTDPKYTLNAAKRDLVREEQHTLIRTHRPAEGVFSVIVADPPWPYETRVDDETHRGRIPYEPMTIEAICAYLKPERSDKDAILWLWITKDHLLEGAHTKVLDAWGFKGKQLYTWVKVDQEGKPRMGGGNWGRGCTEFVILATKGTPHIDHKEADRIVNVFFAERTEEHSEKPERFFTEVIEPICPHPAKLELFARDFEDAPKVRAGWVRDGVQVKRVPVATTHAAASAPIDSAPAEVEESKQPGAGQREGSNPSASAGALSSVVARREWGPGFGFLVDSLVKGDVVELGGKKRGEAIVDGRTKEKKLLVRFEKLNRKKEHDGYEPTARVVEDAAVLAILRCAPRGIDQLGQATKMVIGAWAKDELDVSREPTEEEQEHCWRYLLGVKAQLRANQRPVVAGALRAAASRIRDELDGKRPAKEEHTPKNVAGARAAPPAFPPRRRGPLVDHGEI